MKKKLTTLLLFISLISYSQISKKTWGVGATFSGNYVFGGNNSFSSGAWSSLIELPSVGYFIKDNLSINLSLSVHAVPAVITQLIDDVGPIYSINPSIKYFVEKNKLKPYFQAQYRYGIRNSVAEFTSPTGQALGRYITVDRVQVLQGSVGATYFINNSFGFDIAIYGDESFSKPIEIKASNSIINGGVNNSKILDNAVTYSYSNAGVRLGVSYYFGGNNK
jgi:hypothetical protein